MGLFRSERSTIAISLFFVIIFQLGIVAAVDRPNWDESKWRTELESFRRKYNPNNEPSVDDQIPELIKCALNEPKKSSRCTDNFQKSLVNEIFLRKQFKGHNEDCNSAGTKESELVLNAPKWQNGLIYPLYLEWQEKMINSKLEFCDPHIFLRCSAENKCVCLSGTVRVGDGCGYSHGSHCTGNVFLYIGGQRDTGPLYFDPFQARDESVDTVQITNTGSGCMEKGDYCVGDYRNYYHRHSSYCVDGRIFNIAGRTFQLLFYFFNDKSLSIPFNGPCNLQDHNLLFVSTKEEDENHYDRFKTLEDFYIRHATFCDLESFETCGPSEKCECMSPSTRKDYQYQCVLPDRMDKCEIDPTMEPILMNKSLLPRVRQKLMTGFANSMTCEGNLRCHSEFMEMYCTCPPGTTGQNCNEPLTRFLPIVRVPSLPTDVVGYRKKIEIFRDFNKVAVEFEKVFQREEGSFCVAQIQIEAEILVGEILKLKYPGTTMTTRQYDDLSKKINNFRIPHTRRIICNETLRCQPTTKTCVRVTRRDYLQDFVKTLESFKSRKCAQPDCAKFPKDFDDVVFGGNETLFYGGVHEMNYIRIIEELSKWLKKCDCRNKRVDSMSMSQSSNHFILLMSVVTFFLCNKLLNSYN